MSSKQMFNYQLASKGKRFLASLVEGVILSTATIGLYLILGYSIEEYLNEDFQLSDILYSAISGLLAGAIFYPIFTGNLGHRIFNLKVISAETGADFDRAENGAIRELLKYVLGYLLIPVIWILWDDKNQNLYDKLTKTVVVEKRL